MPAIDSCEPPILRALQKDGWHVRIKPYAIHSGKHLTFADASLERVTEDRIEHIVVVEVKCFNDPQADLPELYTAIGQYLFYRSALLLIGNPPPLYLAVPTRAYARLTSDSVIMAVLQDARIKLIIIDLETEEVVQWIN
ncbi:MAG: hypothetical protein IT324_23775 [Anaerolineae bacterium]|nr:hypothetical protein [Anaerolineae bacterium]